MKSTGIKLLQYVQALYQQKIITKEDKFKLASYINEGMTTADYSKVKVYLKNLTCLKEDRMNIVDKAIKVVDE